MINEMYTVLFLLSLIMLAVLIARFRHRISTYYILLFVSILLANFGYMQMTDADSLKMALFANQTEYLGASFTPFFTFMCMADLCKVKVPKWVQVLALICCGVILTLVSTVGVVDWYYKGVSLVIENGVSRLEKHYGPMHMLLIIYIIANVVAGAFVTIKAIVRKKDVSYTTSILLLISTIITSVMYGLEKILKLGFDLMPISYVIGQFAVLILLRKISLYDVGAISTDSMVESKGHGFVLCDSNGRYLGSEGNATEWFPELKDIKLDSVIKDENTDFLKEIGRWIRKENDDSSIFIEKDGVVIEAEHTILKEQRRKIVHCISLKDVTKQQQYTKLIEQYNENLETEVNNKTQKLRKIQSDIIISMASIVENRDNNTGGHIARTSDVVRIFVKHLMEQKIFYHLTKDVANCIIKAAPLHDFGKIAIPDVILNKPGKFTDEEYNEMKKHSAKGAVIVERILQNSDDEQFKKIAVNVAHYHHEKWDGKGYPEGIKGEEIPFEARVMALADVFDALVSKRVYKESFGYDKAFSIIEESKGTHFEPVLCEEFLHCRPMLEELYNSYDD